MHISFTGNLAVGGASCRAVSSARYGLYTGPQIPSPFQLLHPVPDNDLITPRLLVLRCWWRVQEWGLLIDGVPGRLSSSASSAHTKWRFRSQAETGELTCAEPELGSDCTIGSAVALLLVVSAGRFLPPPPFPIIKVIVLTMRAWTAPRSPPDLVGGASLVAYTWQGRAKAWETHHAIWTISSAPRLQSEEGWGVLPKSLCFWVAGWGPRRP
ncbi:hypothetical protein NDU88_010960 [Pleurodeles waltl]|uniref:Uncharacterized protein n=1 Tax=Pleurodeles waltl TaxID=8319 RepID=A0AAV7PWR9_PLEWA|nr:hypothetical protein NDU88_010960 [Pleurodeles waltl]